MNIKGVKQMCLYKSGKGKIYSDEELNRTFLAAKRKYPGLSAEQYREKLSRELGGLDKLAFDTVSELSANGMPERAALFYARNSGCAMEQARFAVSLLRMDGRC